MSERALSFGSVAESYERFRPSYPAEVFDLIMAYAGRPVRTALEIGAGTGKATRLFARPGITVTATDPDPAMLAELRKHVPPDVRVEQATFEQLPLGERYGLVYVAAALHWTRPEGRWERMAGLLEPGGVVASFGGPAQLADPELETAVRAARARFVDRDDFPPPDGTPADQEMQWPGTELLQSPLFEDVRQATVGRRFTVSTADYLGHLSTISAYVTLPDTDRDEVFQRIVRVLPDEVEVAADITVHLARRR